MGTLFSGGEEQKALPAPEEHLALPASDEVLMIEGEKGSDTLLLSSSETKTPSE